MSYIDSTSGSGDSVANITVVKPADVDPHTLVLALARNGTAGGFIAAPSGWTVRQQIQHASFAAQVVLYTALGTVSNLLFTVPSGSSSLRWAMVAFGGRSGAVSASDALELTTTDITVPDMTAVAGDDGLFTYYNPQATTAFGAAPGGLTDFATLVATESNFTVAYGTNFSTGPIGAKTRTGPNFNSKSGSGILLAATGGTVTVPMGKRIFVNG